MRRIIATLLLSIFAAGACIAAERTENAPACKRAEINPVTGHVFCIDPLGAHVEPPPSDMKPDCETRSRGQWTWAPNCEPAIEGM